MKSFFKKHRNKLLFLFIFLLIPIITLSYTESDKYTLRKNNNSVTAVFKPISSNNTTYEAAGVCFYNNSDLDYFIPNKTRGEWTNFYNLVIDGNPSTVYGVAQKTDCCIDGVCGGSETTESCPIDCGSASCPSSLNFTDPTTGIAQSYPVVTINNQCWTAKNMNVGYYQTLSYPSSPTTNTNISKGCWRDMESKCSTYGGLYTWNQAILSDTTNSSYYQGICPSGWHVANVGEFYSAFQNLGGGTGSSNYSLAAAKMTATGTTFWNSPNATSTNISGFTAIGSGYYDGYNNEYYDGNISEGPVVAAFWGGSNSIVTIRNTPTNLIGSVSVRADDMAASVRCIRDRAAISYDLYYSSGLNGYLTGNVVQSVIPGGSGTAVTAVPNYGYSFYNWSDGSTANPRTDTNVNANKNISASYVPDPCYWGLCNAACTQNCPTYTTGGIGGVYNHDLCDYGLCDASCCYNCQGGYCQ